jgi:hypothetical protein
VGRSTGVGDVRESAGWAPARARPAAGAGSTGRRRYRHGVSRCRHHVPCVFEVNKTMDGFLDEFNTCDIYCRL